MERRMGTCHATLSEGGGQSMAGRERRWKIAQFES